MDQEAAIRTILCIEDDRFIGDMYSQTLRQAGYEVDWETSGLKGLEAATSKQYDLILLDLMLPEKQGSEILATLRGDVDQVPNTRILVLTNFDQDEQARHAMEQKVDGYLIKADITPRKLMEIISQLPKAGTSQPQA